MKAIYITLIFSLNIIMLQAQTIKLEDGSIMPEVFCHEDTNIPLFVATKSTVLSGCGVFQNNGQWYFNSKLASQGVTVFPLSCNITITDQGHILSKRVIIQKPVVILPALKEQGTCDGTFLMNKQDDEQEQYH